GPGPGLAIGLERTPNAAPAASQSPRLKPRPIDLTFRRYGGSSGHDDEVGAFAGFVAETLIRYDQRRAGQNHLRNGFAHFGRDLDTGEHLRRGGRRRTGRRLVFDLASARAAMLAVAWLLFDIARVLRRLAGKRDHIPAHRGAVGPGELERGEYVGAKRRVRLGDDNWGVKQRF